MTDPYPLLFEPIVVPKVWGGQRLAGLGKQLPAGNAAGESWEVVDLSESPTLAESGGAACKPARSLVGNGPLMGSSIADALTAFGRESVYGERSRRDASDARFPLLLKYLDAHQHLSVQVHPSPAYATRQAAEGNAGVRVKHESWVVLEAEPGSVLYLGFREGVSREEFEAAVRGETGAGAVSDLLTAVPAEVGACYTLPSGLVHALGAGVLVAEVQTASDTTFRLYDWAAEYPDRAVAGRTLDVEAGFASMLPDQSPPTRAGLNDAGPAEGVLAQTDAYMIERRVSDRRRVPLGGEAEDGGAVVVMAVRGDGAIAGTGEDSGFAEVPFTCGDTVLVPAAVCPRAEVRGGAGAEVLLVRVL